MKAEIVAAVRAAGVVGAGGAGFPTHVKINAAVDTVIANGAECEPLLRAHQQLMAARSAELVAGLGQVMEATGARQGIIALKRKYEDAARRLEAALENRTGPAIRLFYLPDFYPAGDEQVTVYEATGRIVPEGGIPPSVGVVVANIETLVNVAEALAGKPVTDKYVTVTGAVNNPLTLKVPLGMKVTDLVDICGGSAVQNYRLIDGGPMMGKIVPPDAAITKTTGGVIVLPADHPLIVQKNLPWPAVVNRAQAACCSCRACTDVCPRRLIGHGLQPHRVMQAVGKGFSGAPAALTQVFLCSECGLCETYGCTMGLSPRMVNRELKRQLAKAGVKNPHNSRPQIAPAEREYRRVPIKRLIARLGLTAYDRPAPLSAHQPNPAEVKLLLAQHSGAPARPVVASGDYVAKGQLIAAIPEGATVGANLHASIAGQVLVTDTFIVIRAE